MLRASDSRAASPPRADVCTGRRNVMSSAGRGPKAPRKLLRKCSVHTCYYSVPRYETENNVAFFRLPKDEFRAKLWLKTLGRKSKVPRIEICETHFTKNCISTKNLRTRLIPTAVPTLNLPQPAEAPRGATRHQATQTDSEPRLKLEPPDDDAPEIDIFVKEETVVSQKCTPEAVESSAGSLSDRSIKREILDEDEARDATPERETERPEAEPNESIDSGDGHLESELVKHIEAIVRMQIHSRGKIVDENLSLFALKLFHAFPQAYKLMQRPLGLPSTMQIRKSFRPLQWEACSQWAPLLRARFAGVPPAARACVLCVARAPLRPALKYDAPHDRLCGLRALQPARQAAVLLARGLYKPWRQPLACRLLPAQPDAEKLRLWIRKVVSELFRVGLDVRALVTDFDDRFVPTGPAVTAERPYFAVGNRQVYCFHDCTQLMISFQNYLMAYDVSCGGLTATWEDVEEMHEYNSTRAYPLPTGLTAEHVRPPARGAAGPAGAARHRARLAGQALARPVAAALAAAVELRVLADAAHGTVQLVAALADLYETLHDKELGVAADARAGGGGSSAEIRFLNEMIARLERTSLVSKETGRPLPDPGLLAALRAGVHAAMALHERARRGGATLPMRALNNDPLHEFFDRVRARDDYRTATSERMLAAFRRSFAFNIMKPLEPSPGDGRFEEFLKAASEIRNVPRSGPVAPAPAPRLERWSALLRLARGRRSAPVLARQLLARCLAAHGGCEPARAYCLSERLPEGLLRHMELMSCKFRTHFAEVADGPAGLLQALLGLMAGEPFEAPCACFPALYLQTMFFRFKIRTLVEFNNNRFARNPSAEFTMETPHVDLCD